MTAFANRRTQKGRVETARQQVLQLPGRRALDQPGLDVRMTLLEFAEQGRRQADRGAVDRADAQRRSPGFSEPPHVAFRTSALGHLMVDEKATKFPPRWS